MKKKSPVAAALLNFLLPGLGYFYLRQRRMFGGLIIAGQLLIGVSTASGEAGRALDSFLGTNWTLFIYAIIGSVVLKFAFALDAFRSAKLGNQNG